MAGPMLKRHHAAILVIFCAVCFVIIGRLPGRDLLSREIHNVGHVLVFNLVALLLIYVLGQSGSRFRRSPLLLYSAGFAIACVLAAIAEYLQRYTGRQPNPMDIARNILGVISGSFLYAAVDLCTRAKRPLLSSAGAVLLSVLLTSAGTYPLVALLQDFNARDRAFPLLLDFDADWSKRLVKLNGAIMTRPSEDKIKAVYQDGPFVLLRFNRVRYPGISIVEPHPDWSGRERLVFMIGSDEKEAFRLVLRVHDFWHDHRFEDRFNLELQIKPGINRISVPVALIQAAPLDRKLDLTRIAELALFVPDNPWSSSRMPAFYLGNIRLE